MQETLKQVRKNIIIGYKLDQTIYAALTIPSVAEAPFT